MTRTHKLGGTDAASLIGLGRLSPTALYLRLRGEVPDDFEGNEATDAGLLFEDHVAVPLARKSLQMDLRRPITRTLTLPDEPRIGASMDFEVDGTPEWADIKLTGSRATWGNPGEKVPVAVGAQMQFQMAVARASGRVVPCVHVIACFVPGFAMVDFPVEEDREVGDALLGKARQMLAAVDAGEPPVPGDEADARALFLGKRGEVYVATGEDVALIQQYREAKKAEREVEERIAILRNALIPKLGNATEIVDAHGELLGTYRPNKVFDEDAFKVANPGLWETCSTLVLNRAKLEKAAGKKIIEAFKREPANPQEAVRVFKIKED